MSRMVIGRNPVLQTLQLNRPIQRILIQRQLKQDQKIQHILKQAQQQGVSVQYTDGRDLDKRSGNVRHQGVIAIVPPFQYVEIEDILQNIQDRNETPFLLILDEIEDPHNFGAVIRTAAAAGAHGIVIQQRRQVEVTPAVVKVSMGTVDLIPIARVPNIVQIMKKLKEQGIWIVGTELQTEMMYDDVDYTLPLALVVGNEGKGLSRLVRETCDFRVKIPIMNPMVESLNASVASAIMIYKVIEMRTKS